MPVSEWGKIKVKTSDAKSCFKFKEDDGGKLVFATYFFKGKTLCYTIIDRMMRTAQRKSTWLARSCVVRKKYHLKNIFFQKKPNVLFCSRSCQLRPAPLLRLWQRCQVLWLWHGGRWDHPAASGERPQRTKTIMLPARDIQTHTYWYLYTMSFWIIVIFSLLPTATELQSQDAWTRAVPPQRIAWTQVFAHFFLSFCFFTHFKKKI